MRTLHLRFHHVAAALIVLAVTVSLWSNSGALSAGATADKADNPRGGMPPVSCDRPKNDAAGETACHVTQPTEGCAGGSVEILDLPECYAPGLTYHLKVRVTGGEATRLRWGFEVGVQYNTGDADVNKTAGQLDNDGGRTQVVGSDDSQRQFVTHKSGTDLPDGTYAGEAGPKEWPFQWVAPADGKPVCFYAAGVAADNANDRGGDCVYRQKVCLAACGATDTHKSTWGWLKIRYNQ